jgi:hypothetical protein
MVAVGFAVSLSMVGGARASDIACKSPAGDSSVRCEDPNGDGMRCALSTDGPRPHIRQKHLICESAALSGRYERIYAEQQRMLRKGTIRDSDIAEWRVRRDACDSARCLESLFSKFWRDRDTIRNAPARPVPPAPDAAAISNAGRHEPAHPATATPTPRAQEEPTSAKSLAKPVKPVPVEFTRPTAPPFETPTAHPFAKNLDSSSVESSPAALAMESLLSGLAILGMGAGFLWTRRTSRTRSGRRSAIPGAMVIAFGLLFVNALLLPFTLGLK